jgi:hypothetical protein
MRTLCIPLLALAACQTPPNVDLGAVVRDAVVTVDANRDGNITNREVKDSQGNVYLWTSIAAAIMGLLGLTQAQGAKGVAKQAQVETDEQWDILTGLAGKKP